MLSIKKQIYKNKGFIIKSRTRNVQKRLSNGKTITKVEHYDCLTDVLPQAIVKGTVTLPDVDSIAFGAFENIKESETLRKIVLPKNLKEITKEHHVAPFFYLKDWVVIEMPEVGISNFFMEDGKLYEVENYIKGQNELLPTSVELIYANPYTASAPQSRASFISFNNPTPKTADTKIASNLQNVRNLKINPGAYKQSKLDSISVSLPPNTNLFINSIKSQDLKRFGMPNELIVNGVKLTQSQFLTHGARMLVGVFNTNGQLMLQHIDGSNDVEKYWNADEVVEPVECWNDKIEKEKLTFNNLTAKRQSRYR